MDWVASGFSLLYGIAGALVSVHRYFQFETGYYDFGIFDQAIWRVSRFSAPIIDHLAIGGKVIFADHVSPIIYLLSPLYWLTSRSESILISQALIVAASIFAMYMLGKRILAHPFVAFSVAVTYGLFIGIQNAVITDFHEITLLTLPLILLFLTIECGWKKRYFFFLILILAVKENIALLGASIGLYILITKPSWRTIGITTIIISLVWGVVATMLIIPFFSEGMSQYAPTFPKDAAQLFTSFVDHPVKRETLWIGFGNFLFLPLLYPPLWPAIIQELASRFFLSQSTLRWSLSLHYGTELGLLLSLSSLYALRVIQNKLPKKTWLLWGIGVVLIAQALYNHQVKLHGPLGLSYNPAFYRHSKDFAFLQTLIDRIPPGATVMTQNNVASHLTHQPVMLFRADYSPFLPDFVIFDLREGQNPNNLFPQNRETLVRLREKLSSDPLYTSVYATQDQEIFMK